MTRNVPPTAGLSSFTLRRRTRANSNARQSASRVKRKTVPDSTSGAAGHSVYIRTEYNYWGNTFLPSRERRIDASSGRTRDTDFTYDAAGRLLSTDGPLPGTDDATYSRYDGFGRKTWEIGPRSPEGLR